MKIKKWNKFNINESNLNSSLTIDDLSDEQKDYLVKARYDTSVTPFDGIHFISDEHEYVEYGDIVHTITFEYEPENAFYELYILWEAGPGTWSWDGDNNEGLEPEITQIENPKSNPKVDSKEVFDYIKKMISTWESKGDKISDEKMYKVDAYKAILDRFNIKY